MAQEEIIFKVGVDTGDSAQNVNNVGDAFDNVKKKVELSGRSLAELQEEFKKVTNELKALNPNSKEFGELAEKAKALKTEMKAVGNSLNDTTDHTKKSFVGLRQELKQLTIQLQGLDPASKEFETVARRAGQIKEQMRGVADAINDADPEKFGGKFQRTAEGIAGAFSAVTGAQALFGQQSEEIEKQMLKVQGAIALTQGISAMKELKNDALDFATSIKTKLVGAFTSLTVAEMANAEATGTMTLLQKAYALAVGTSTGAMKVFRLALAATGIGALVVLVGFLIEKIASFVSNTDEATKAQNRFTSATKKYNDQLERERSNMEKQIQFQLDFAKAVGASEEKQYEIQKSGLRKREILRQSDLEMNKLHIQYLKQQKQDAIEEENFELVKAINEEITKTKEKNNELISLKYQLQQEDIKLTAQHNTDLKNKQSDANKEALEKQKEASQKAKEQKEKEAQEQLELQRKIEDLTVANIDDANARDIVALKLKHDRELEEMQKQYGKKKEFAELEKQLLIQQENEKTALLDEQKKVKDEKTKAEIEKANNDAKALLEADIIRAEENFNLKQQKRIELENLDFAQQMQNTELTNAQKELLKAQHEANLLNIAKDSAERQKQLDEELANAKSFLVEQTSAMFGQLASSAQQGSAIQKAFAITQVTIDTAKSISSVIAGATAAAAAGGPAAPFLIGGYIASGIATVTKAFSSVNNILKKPMPNVQPPTTNRPIDNAQGTQGAQQTVQAQSTYKVVVVDSDITKMQDKTKKVNAISTI